MVHEKISICKKKSDNRKKKFIVMALIGLAVCSCIDIETRGQIRTLERVIKQSNASLVNKGFVLRSYGGKGNPTIQNIDMGYQTTDYKFKSVDEARSFFVPICEEYLKPFNAEKSIRPYLINYPVDMSILNLSITFMDGPNFSYMAPWIASVHASNGRITYFVHTPDKTYSTVLFREPYEEALTIVSQESKHSHAVGVNEF